MKIRYSFFSILLLALSTSVHGAKTVTSPAQLPPDDGSIKIFLAGSIEMGAAANWQSEVQAAPSSEKVVFLNPRREDWNPAWKPEASDPNFREQVEWELAALEEADIILMYFSPGTQSPVTLLEFGLYAQSGKLLVAAPTGFWRKGNVEITGERYNVPRYGDLAGLIQAVRLRIGVE